MADLKARGILKDRTPEEQAALEKEQLRIENEGIPWLMILGVFVGVL